jgi:hypothetical protein
MRAILLAATLLVVSAPLAACSGNPAAMQARLQPLPERFTQAWSHPINSQGYTYYAPAPGMIAFAYGGGQVAFINPAGDLTIASALTGRAQHAIASVPSWSFNQISIVGDRLYTESIQNDSNQVMLAAYTFPAMRLIWRNELYGGDGTPTVLATDDGVVFIQGSLAGPGLMMEGLNEATGELTWHRPSGMCLGDTPAAASVSTAYLVQCITGNQFAVEAIRPSDGRVMWRHVYAVANSSQVGAVLQASDDGYVFAVLTSTKAYLYAPNGATLRKIACPECSDAFEATGAHSVLQLSTFSGGGAIQDISLPSGRVLWQREGEIFSTVPQPLLVESNGVVYGQGGSAVADAANSELEPFFVTALQAATGRSVTLPLPVSGGWLLGASDGLVYVLYGTPSAPYNLAAFRPEQGPDTKEAPAILGGVNPAAWPNACILLTSAEIGHVIGPGYVAVPGRGLALAGVTMPQPDSCTYVGPAVDDPVVVVTIAWVAPTAAQANELIRTWITLYAGTRFSGGYLVSDGTANDIDDRALIAAGRAIVTVTVPGNAADARALVTPVEDHLNKAIG